MYPFSPKVGTSGVFNKPGGTNSKMDPDIESEAFNFQNRKSGAKLSNTKSNRIFQSSSRGGSSFSDLKKRQRRLRFGRSNLNEEISGIGGGPTFYVGGEGTFQND